MFSAATAVEAGGASFSNTQRFAKVDRSAASIVSKVALLENCGTGLTSVTQRSTTLTKVVLQMMVKIIWAVGGESEGKNGYAPNEPSAAGHARRRDNSLFEVGVV